MAPSKAPGRISGACGPSPLLLFRTRSGGACAPWWPPSTSDDSTAHGARILAVPGDAVNAARRRMRGNCAPQLLRQLCSAGCARGGRVPKPSAPRRSAERPAGSAEREAGTRKRRCCCFLSSLQLRSRAHGFAGPAAIEPRRSGGPWRRAPGRVPGGVQREGGGGALAAEAPPLPDRLPALPLRSRCAPSPITSRDSSGSGGLGDGSGPVEPASRGRPLQPCRCPPGRRRPTPAAWLPARSCTGGRRAPVAAMAAQAAAGSPGRFRPRGRALAPHSAQGACGLPGLCPPPLMG